MGCVMKAEKEGSRTIASQAWGVELECKKAELGFGNWRPGWGKEGWAGSSKKGKRARGTPGAHPGVHLGGKALGDRRRGENQDCQRKLKAGNLTMVRLVNRLEGSDKLPQRIEHPQKLS